MFLVAVLRLRRRCSRASRPLCYSYGAYLHEQRKRVLTLRELANQGRATTRDPVLNFLVKIADNGVVWNVLSHWPSPRC